MTLDQLLTSIIARRVKVEQQLLDMASGKLPMPDAAKLRAIALELGTPDTRRPHPRTGVLLHDFMKALTDKLIKAEDKYKYTDNWANADPDELRQELLRHVKKGDPIDVAAYAMFLWYHNASTAQQNVTPVRPPQVDY